MFDIQGIFTFNNLFEAINVIENNRIIVFGLKFSLELRILIPRKIKHSELYHIVFTSNACVIV